MAATKMNSVFQCIDQSIGHAFRRDQWQGILKGRFSEIEPWLIPSGRRSETFGCARSPHCHYRIVEHADGSFVGVCDEGRCDRRPFAPEELVQYHPNFVRFRLELARLLELEPDRSEPPQPNVLPIGKMTLGKDRMEVKLVGGLNPSYLPQILMRFLNVRGPRQIILLASSYDGKADLKDFVYRVGWSHFDIEHAFTLHPTQLRWQDGAQARWEAFRNELSAPGNVQEAAARPYVRAIERGFRELGKDINGYRDQIQSLRAGLSEQLRTIFNEVEPDFFQMILALLVDGSVRSAAERLNLTKSTFDRRLKAFTSRGGLYTSLHGLVGIRAAHFGSRRLETFSETYAAHQVTTQGGTHEAVIEELVQALEDTNPEIWPEVLSEFSDSLRGCS
jgi:hypothetical protein